MAELRVIGLVRLMRWAQAQLTMGISAEGADSFRTAIRQAIRQVDGLLERNHAPASKLPKPSFEAYRYLKGVELDRLPPPKTASRKKRTPIGMAAAVQEAMLAGLPDIRTGKAEGVAAALREQIAGAAQVVEIACRRQGIQKGDLPGPTRRAALWLDFLSDPQMLAAHLQTLARLDRLAHQAVRGKSEVQVALANLAVLYRVNNRGRLLELIVHEGFLGASDEVLTALAGMALSRRSARRSQLVRAYTASPQFLTYSRSLATGGAKEHAAPQSGELRQLVETFERINRDFFGGSLTRPALNWSRGLTYREFGHYQPSSDTVSISRSLIEPSVPAYVLDFVMYHELLHKQLGVKTSGTRQYAHTAEFRREEQRFPRCAEAKACLDDLSRQLAPRRRTPR